MDFTTVTLIISELIQLISRVLQYKAIPQFCRPIMYKHKLGICNLLSFDSVNILELEVDSGPLIKKKIVSKKGKQAYAIVQTVGKRPDLHEFPVAELE